MIRKEFLSILSNLELERKSRSFKVKAGNAESSKRGRGLDFKDVRLYDFGDDTRLIDWNVTSRFGELYVREFYEEKERQAIVFYDVSSSMEWGSGEFSRAENAFQVLALISLLYVQREIGLRSFSIVIGWNGKLIFTFQKRTASCVTKNFF